MLKINISSVLFHHAVRLSETLYSVKSVGDSGSRIEELHRTRGITGAEKSCLPASIQEAKKLEKGEESRLLSSGRECQRSVDLMNLSGQSVYLDSDISAELQNKVSSTIFWEHSIFVFVSL